jgi:hypothetical protein
MVAYKGHEVPAGSDAANVPQSFRNFVDGLGPSYASTTAADTAGVPNNFIVLIAGRLRYKNSGIWHYVDDFPASSQTNYPSSPTGFKRRIIPVASSAPEVEIFDSKTSNAANSGWDRQPGVPRILYNDYNPAYGQMGVGTVHAGSILGLDTKQQFRLHVQMIFQWDFGVITAGTAGFYELTRHWIQYSYNNSAFVNLRFADYETTHYPYIGNYVAKNTMTLQFSQLVDAGNHRFRGQMESVAVGTGGGVRPVRISTNISPSYTWVNQ